MKTFARFIMAALLAGTTVVQAQTSQELDSIMSTPLGLTLKAKLTDGTIVTEATLGGNLSFATVELLNINPLDGDTNCTSTVNVVGSSLGTSNYIDTTFGITNVVISGVLLAETSDVNLPKGKGVSTFGQEAAILRGTRALRCGDCDPVPGFAVPENVLSNSTWTVLTTFHVSNAKTSLVGQVAGVWQDGVTGFKGVVKNAK
jgi:hypothetical protein